MSTGNCWGYVDKPISIGGQLLERYATIEDGCDGDVALTFDVRGWKSFKGFAGIASNDSRPNNLTIKVDGERVAIVQIFYNRAPYPLEVDLEGHKTLTFEKSGQYPLVVIGEPRLTRS